ncbi:3-hydroxybutyrate dehydrogenase [Pseudoalteromonas sp. SSM20]|uniref:3-hydroxybutyrate dehydrogenase n=1 Tax=unclassified Pseudoalteromonas TaxID=194690 RepID=UPI000CF70B19|nr:MULTISPECIES: 3-hydroxybutyrate dehydrogenase [unclassified Pseudoalteromonas]MDE3271979.1 3-hydroxybutyrate dehydrogenase [Pseudoalteromonas sp. G4]MEC8327563.1 3-hydroxybutyrate dehydrogenase [Pseudomonadota bacterium]
MNKHILITGGASGIGLGIAEALADSDTLITVTDLNQDAALEAAKKLSSKGYHALGVALNVTDEAAIIQLLSELPAPVDVLINNAGIQHVAALEEFPQNQWRLLVDVMLTGTALMTKAVLPSMRERNFGRVINIGSIHSLVASRFKSAYVAAKHGLVGFSKVMALETAEHDITINTICPAYVKTPLVEKQIADQAKNHGISEQQVIEQIMLAPMPKKSFIDIAEIAHTVRFLMAKEACNITGQTLALDGGWTAQ